MSLVQTITLSCSWETWSQSFWGMSLCRIRGIKTKRKWSHLRTLSASESARKALHSTVILKVKTNTCSRLWRSNLILKIIGTPIKFTLDCRKMDSNWCARITYSLLNTARWIQATTSGWSWLTQTLTISNIPSKRTSMGHLILFHRKWKSMNNRATNSEEDVLAEEMLTSWPIEQIHGSGANSSTQRKEKTKYMMTTGAFGTLTTFQMSKTFESIRTVGQKLKYYISKISKYYNLAQCWKTIFTSEC